MSTVDTAPLESDPSLGPAGRVWSSLRTSLRPVGFGLAVVGALLLLAGCFLSWSYTSEVLGDVSINLYPGAVQLLMVIAALLALLLLLVHRRIIPRLGDSVAASAAAVLELGLGSLACHARRDRPRSPTAAAG